ncbi:MAG: hypothetical protein ACLQB1_19080 [Streptosporangiaceae bacterium]
MRAASNGAHAGLAVLVDADVPLSTDGHPQRQRAPGPPTRAMSAQAMEIVPENVSG